LRNAKSDDQDEADLDDEDDRFEDHAGGCVAVSGARSSRAGGRC
jgi:hypothetical protein